MKNFPTIPLKVNCKNGSVIRKRLKGYAVHMKTTQTHPCFIMFCGCQLPIDFTDILKSTTLAQSYEYHSAIEATVKNMGK